MGHASTHSFVYFVRCGEYVKIGFSYDPHGRVKYLRSALGAGRGGLVPNDFESWRELELVHLIPGCRMRDERIIHGLFAQHRVAGEWFRYDLAFQRQLAGLQYFSCHDREVYVRRVRAHAKKARARAVTRRAA